MTQKADILNYLESHGSITRLEAFTECGVAELSARIIDLENDGYQIPRETVEVEARNGRKCRVTKYKAPTIQREMFV